MKSSSPEPLDELVELVNMARKINQKFIVYCDYNYEYFVSDVDRGVYAQGSANEIRQYLRGYRDCINHF